MTSQIWHSVLQVEKSKLCNYSFKNIAHFNLKIFDQKVLPIQLKQEDCDKYLVSPKRGTADFEDFVLFLEFF